MQLWQCTANAASSSAVKKLNAFPSLPIREVSSEYEIPTTEMENVYEEPDATVGSTAVGGLCYEIMGHGAGVPKMAVDGGV
ncbi:hypothetical protein GBAR_LOCUS13214 [Geodia barretti]|uniref:Uncharacterized protein n=1 Tax=Geodia barretti TaxID=519541 RepID=A0AA35S313_GEOBA|nr:hypothetical protein GBAR_LOCUS13214 [Geodia barretti]